MYTFAIIALFLVMFGAANLAFICVVAAHESALAS